MARLVPGVNVRLQGILDPVDDTDGANKEYVDSNIGGGITASGGLQRIGDDISIVDEGVTTGKLDDDAVTAAKLADDSVTTGAIVASAVNTDELTDLAVNTAKLADNAVTADKIASNAVTSDAIAQHAVTTFEIAPEAIDEVRLNATNTPTAGQILSAAGTDDQFTWISQTDQGNTLEAGEFISITTVDTTDTIAVADVYDPVNDETFTKSASADTIPAGQFFWTESSGQLTLNPTNPESTDDIAAAVRPGMAIRITKNNSLGTVDIAYYGIRFSLPGQNFYTLDLIPDSDSNSDSFFDDPALGTDSFKFVALQLQAGGSFSEANVGWLKDVSDDDPSTGEALIWNGGQSEWQPTETVNTITNGGHIVPGTNTDGSVSLTFDETFDLWNGTDDWVQINSGTPTGTNILWDTATNTLTVPSVGLDDEGDPRTVLDILLNARSGMAVQIRQENSTPNPSSFSSGFFQITDITATETPAQVIMKLLEDGSDIFTEEEGGTYTYQLTILQFVTGGSLDNLTLDGLADVDVSTPPTNGQVLAFDTASGTYQPVNNGSGGGVSSLDDLSDVSITSVADEQILRYDADTSQFVNVDLPASSNPDLGDLGDVNTNGVADGFLIRYDGDNNNYRAHSVSNTLSVYGGVNVNRNGTLVDPIASGLNSLAVGNDTEATGEDSIAIGIQAEGTSEAAIAVGAGATATAASTLAIGELTSAAHANSSAIGEGAGTDENNELRLGSDGTHVTVASSVAGNESDDNQLVSKRWVNNQISDASRVISSTANALENLTTVTDSTPWDDYRIVPGTSLVPELQVHMYEFDATESQFIFYPGFLSDAITGTGADLTVGTIPDFFEEVTDIANESEVTNAGGDAVTSLGWKYLGHDTATVWQAVSHVFTFNFDWIYPAGNSDGTQNPPDVTSSIELVRLKPLSDNTYNMNENATVIASSPTSFHNAGSLNPGDNETFTGSYEFAQQLLADGISNVENGDVFTYRMKIRYKGNGFDGDTNVRLSITESETANIVPQLGIRHVGRDYSLTLEDSGDLMWEDHNLSLETLLLIENTTDGPEIPAATLGLIAGDNITITGKTIASTAATSLTAGDGIDITSDTVSVDLSSNSALEFNGSGELQVDLQASSGLAIGGTGIGINTLRANGTFINSSTNNIGVALRQDLTGNGLSFGGSGTDAGLFVDLADSNSGLVRAADGIMVDSGDGIALNANGVSIDFRTETNNPLEVSGTGDAAGLALNIDEDGPLQKTANGLDVILETQGGLGIGSLTSGIEVLLPANSGLQTDATGLSLDADLTDLGDVNISGTPVDGQILEYDAATSMWINTTLSGNHSFTAGTGLEFNTDSTVLNFTGDLDDLSDVDLTSKVATDGQILKYDATSTPPVWVPADEASGAESLSDLDDVSNTAPSNGQALVYNNSTSLWTPAGVGEEYVAINFSSGDGTPDIGLQARAIGIGPGSAVSGIAGMAVGWNSNAGGNLGIAIGERATVGDARGIAIGSSTNSASDTADLCQATGEQSIAIGRAARATNTNAIALGDDTRALTTDTTAIGASAQVTGTATGSTAIGHNATASLANTTVLGNGTSHRVFAGSNELATISNNSGDITNIECSINNEFFSDGFNPSSTNSEILRYTQVGDLAIGRFDFKIASSTTTNFLDGDRWVINSTSTPMVDAFGYAVGTYGIAIGTFVVAGSAANSAAMGDIWLRPDSSTSVVRILFRVRDVIGTAPTRDSYISAQFNIAKF